MTAKILQFANSALIGLRCNVSNPVQAVCFLGLDMVRALVMSVHVFSQFESDQLQRFGMRELWEHSFRTGILAQAIARLEKMPQHIQDDSFTGGLLHDVGKLILVTTMTPMYQTIVEKVAEGGVSLVDAEREYLGCSHGEVGAYLIGIWGLPHTIVEAVAWHHSPMAVAEPGFSALTAVHVANTLAPLLAAPLLPPSRLMDQAYLAATGLADRLPLWREECEKKLAHTQPEEVAHE
jgi:HD-like signal output (HDOD) protein